MIILILIVPVTYHPNLGQIIISDQCSFLKKEEEKKGRADVAFSHPALQVFALTPFHHSPPRHILFPAPSGIYKKAALLIPDLDQQRFERPALLLAQLDCRGLAETGTGNWEW